MIWLTMVPAYTAVQLKEGADNIWAIVTPEHCTVEQRWRAPHARAYPQVGKASYPSMLSLSRYFCQGTRRPALQLAVRIASVARQHAQMRLPCRHMHLAAKRGMRVTDSCTRRAGHRGGLQVVPAPPLCQSALRHADLGHPAAPVPAVLRQLPLADDQQLPGRHAERGAQLRLCLTCLLCCRLVALLDLCCLGTAQPVFS
jgi:hypothetical protein